MNLQYLNPVNWGKGYRKSQPDGAPNTTRDSAPEGPYSPLFEQWVAREVNPYLYEALREALGVIDGAINMMVMLDGIIRVDADSDRLQRQIQDFTDNVLVNDMEHGLQAFYRLQSNEMYEQGCTIGEPILADDGRDVIQLKVADSKGIYFKRVKGQPIESWYKPPGLQRGRRDGTDQIERVLRNTYASACSYAQNLSSHGYHQLDAARLVYSAFNPEADNAYGVSIMRGTEFDSRILLVMKNALHQTWGRFGDPSFSVTLKTKSKVIDPDTKRKGLADNLAEVLNIKRQGNSADFVNVVGPQDELNISVLGADGQVLEIEAPARHVLEQIVGKTSLPSWMLGFHWSTAERLAQKQGELVLQGSKTRFETRRMGLMSIVETALRARGVTWNPGDYQLVQELPSLQDLLAVSQANFLDAQADMVRGGGQTNDDVPGDGNRPKVATVTAGGEIILPTDDVMIAREKRVCNHSKAENYVEDADALTRLERKAERAMLAAWDDLQDDVFGVLRLDAFKTAKSSHEPVFIFDQALVSQLTSLQEAFIASVGANDAALATSMFDGWLRGIANGAGELGVDEVIAAVRADTQTSLAASGIDLVRNATVRGLRDDIVAQLADAAYDGMNMRDAARALKQRFDAHDTDWERIARSEIAAAQGEGKLAQYAAHDIEQYDWVRAGGACPICIGLEKGSPYTLGSGPVPMRDSHPNCRCTVQAVVPE